MYRCCFCGEFMEDNWKLVDLLMMPADIKEVLKTYHERGAFAKIFVCPDKHIVVWIVYLGPADKGTFQYVKEIWQERTPEKPSLLQQMINLRLRVREFFAH